jgi:hypothetical protein
MRTIIDQNGKKWAVSIYGSKYSLGVDELPEQISVMTLLFESDSGESRSRKTGECPLEAISEKELLEILNRDDESDT